MAEHTHTITKIIKLARPFPDPRGVKNFSQVGDKYSNVKHKNLNKILGE